jgi:hypothetical protein
MPIRWEDDYDAAVKAAAAQGKPLYVDFWSPESGGSRQMEAVTYPDRTVQARLQSSFVCSRQEIGRQRALAGRLIVFWTPGLLFMDSNEVAFYRGYGYYPPHEFAQMILVARGLWELNAGHTAAAIAIFRKLAVEGQDTPFRPEALYWLGVAHYKEGDLENLVRHWSTLLKQHPHSIWSKKASVMRAA